MSKLVDDMREQRKKRGVRQSMAHEGSPCPFCDGKRMVVVYLSVQVRKRQTAAHQFQKDGLSTRGRDFNVARPSFWQGACMECASAIQDEVADRANRHDYLRKVHDGEGEG